MTDITATRYHDICAGHRVVGHEGKCQFLHGHNYRVHFTVQAQSLDNLGRVLDFSCIKSTLCEWLENNWDHKTLLWSQDPLLALDATTSMAKTIFENSLVVVPFNPTAENMGQYLVDTIGPLCLYGTGATLVKVVIEETRKCSVTVGV